MVFLVQNIIRPTRIRAVIAVFGCFKPMTTGGGGFLIS